MRILIQGAGSIGQRHYRNALTLGHEPAFLRSSTQKRAFVQEFFDAQEREGRVPLEFLSLEAAVREWQPSVLIIATPNHQHLEHALEGARLGLHLLIEKPVHDSVDGMSALARLVEEQSLVAMVGYNLRFHPLLMRVKALVEERSLGSILSASVEVGENIEDWHPWEQYAETYAPYVASGGGALLCFSHDIDYLYWLLGTPSTIEAAGGKRTPLTGDAEDLVQMLWTYAQGETALLHVDYFQRPKVRTLKIMGTKGTILWNAYGSLMIIDHHTGETVEESVPEGFERNDMFLEELSHFIACIETGSAPRTPLSEGIEVLNIIESIKEKLV